MIKVFWLQEFGYIEQELIWWWHLYILIKFSQKFSNLLTNNFIFIHLRFDKNKIIAKLFSNKSRQPGLNSELSCNIICCLNHLQITDCHRLIFQLRIVSNLNLCLQLRKTYPYQREPKSLMCPNLWHGQALFSCNPFDDSPIVANQLCVLLSLPYTSQLSL